MQQLFSNFFLWYSANINKVFFFTCYIFLAILFSERLLVIFSYEAHTAGIDNNFDYPVIRSLAGYNLYPDPSAYPYAVNPYAPLFFLVCKWVAILFNVGAADTIGVYRVSRAVSLAADAGTCLLLFITLYRQLKISRPASIAITTLFFGLVSYLGYTINRSDSLFLFFYCSTFGFLIKTSPGSKFRHVCIISALTTLCIFSKQNGVSLLLLIPAWLTLEKNYRGLLQFVCFSAIFCGGLFIYFEYFYTSHFFSAHIINALKNKIDIRWFYVYVFKLIADSLLFLPLSVALIVSVKSIADNNSNKLLQKTGIVFMLQFIISTALCLKWGSSRGYYNECFLLAGIILAGYCCTIEKDRTARLAGTIGIYSYPALLLFIFHVTAQLFFFFINSNAEAKKKFAEQAEISKYIKSQPGHKDSFVIDLSDPDFNFFKNLLYKESAAPNMDAVSCCTLPDRIFNYKGLTDGLMNGKIGFLIQKKMTPVQSKWGINLYHYKLDTSFTTYSVYKYNSPVLK